VTDRLPGRDDTNPPPKINPTVAHPARIWNYWLGGIDNYASDREIGDQTIAAYPHIVELARAQRAFLVRVVTHLVRDVGARQLLDIGTGLPTANNTHEVAQAIAPEARIVYVDNDPLVLAHARALLTSTPLGVTDYVDADLRDPDRILHAASQTLDFTEPVAITMLGIVIFITDDQEANRIVDRLVEALPSGSYLAMTHTTNAIHGATTDEAVRIWNEGGSTPMVVRSLDQIGRFFRGLELLEPGLVPLTRWRPDSADTAAPEVDEFCAVGIKP
jgi:O-methyltransferase involved in polyketide biosynthesis